MSSLPSSPSSTSSASVTASGALSAPDPAGYGRADPWLRRSDTGSRSDQSGRPSFVAPDRKRRLARPQDDLWRHASGRVESRGHEHRSTRGVSGLQPAVQGDPTTGSSYDTPIDLSSPAQPLFRRTSRQERSQRANGRDHVEYFLPRWQPDSEVTHCPVCGTQFSFWYRRHHCRKCGRVVCSSCSPHRITIPRQFIVRPSEFGGSPGQMVPPHAAQTTHHGDHSAPSPTAFNPALGGGEEVRLCNPCVPDPNPEPPRGYAVPPRHRARHSMSAAGPQSPYGVLLPERPARRTVGSHDYPDFWGVLPGREGYQGGSSAYRYSGSSLHRSPPHEESGPSGWLSRYDYATEAPRRPHRPPHRIEERDVCPVCNRRFRPLGEAGDEEARETHIRQCIEGHGPQARASSPRSPSHPAHVRMIGYPATEKDCLGQDGAPQECTICMEEYEVGQSMVRLECLCMFHKRCLMEWFQRKKECPVHKVS